MGPLRSRISVERFDSRSFSDSDRPEGWYLDPFDADVHSLRWWDGAEWTSDQKLLTRGERQAYEQRAERPGWLLVHEVVILGGYGHDVEPGEVFDVSFQDDHLVLGRRHQLEFDDKVRISYAEIEELEIGGPGELTKGGGFIGGGFGLEGFAIGAAAAGVLNALTTRTRVETVVGVRSADSELIFLTSTHTPEALKIKLSRVFGVIRGSHAAERSETADLSERLTRMANLVERGFLTREEFELATDLERARRGLGRPHPRGGTDQAAVGTSRGGSRSPPRRGVSPRSLTKVNR